MVRDTLTLEDLEACSRTLDTAPIPTTNRYVCPLGWTNQYYNEPIETETMNGCPMMTTESGCQASTTVTTTTEKTTRTAQDIVKSLRNSTYITKDKRFLVSSTWGDSIRVAFNPLTECRGTDTTIYLSVETLKELSTISQLLKAIDSGKSAGYEEQDAVYELNKEESM